MIAQASRIGMPPSSVPQPPIVMIRIKAVDTSSNNTTVTRVAWATGLPRVGGGMITPGPPRLSPLDAIAVLTIQSGAVLTQPRGRGGIGRHAGLRSQWAYALGGSSPSARTDLRLLQPAISAAGWARASSAARTHSMKISTPG